MVENQEQDPKKEESRKRGGKTFPVLSFNDALVLAKGIIDYGVGSQIRRLTLFDKIQRSPNSGPSRNLVTTSSKYGLTVGGYNAEYLTITEDAQNILSETISERDRRKLCFQLAIQNQSVFQRLYERLKNKRIPTDDVIKDELLSLQVPKGDLGPAAEVFLQNVRDLDLIREISGKDTLIPTEQVLEELPSGKPGKSTKTEDELLLPAASAQPSPTSPPGLPKTRLEPSVHIDIQIHIDSTASPEQIDQIFSSMARHIYQK